MSGRTVVVLVLSSRERMPPLRGPFKIVLHASPHPRTLHCLELWPGWVKKDRINAGQPLFKCWPAEIPSESSAFSQSRLAASGTNHVREALEEVVRILRAGRGFRMVLYREHRPPGQGNS